MRNLEHNVKFDINLKCFQESWKQNGVENKYDSYCQNKEVHWSSLDYPQCSSYDSKVDVGSYINYFWGQYNLFNQYQAIVDDPYFQTGVKFHRVKHATENRWIWFRVNDTALVYEQYYDGTQ